MTLSANEIEQYRTSISNAEKQAHKAEANKESAMKELSTKYNCSTIEEAKDLISKFEADIKKLESKNSKLETKIVTGIQEIEQMEEEL